MQKQTALKAQRDEIQGVLAESSKAAAHIDQCRRTAETTPTAISEWDETLIRQVVENVTVETGNEIIRSLEIRSINTSEIIVISNGKNRGLSNKIPAFLFWRGVTYATLFYARHAAAGDGAVDDVSARS